MSETTLFVKDNDKQAVPVKEESFISEQNLEDYICNNPEILGDIYIIKRQVRLNSGADIPDIIGVDNDGNIVLIEIKNKTIDEQIISQVLRYAIWADTNPDSIKSLWLECQDRPDELEIDWANNEVRILIIGPQIKSNVSTYAGKIEYDVELLEVKLLRQPDREYVLVNRIEPEKSSITSKKPTSGRMDYDEAFYKSERNHKSVDFFYKVVKDCEEVIKNKNWGLETRFNKYYCGFKYGNPLVFSVRWLGSKSLALAFKLSKEDAEKLQGQETMHNYDGGWKEANYKLDPDTFKVDNYIPLMEGSYKKITGK